MDIYTRKRDTGEPTRNTGEFGSKPQHTPEGGLDSNPKTAPDLSLVWHDAAGRLHREDGPARIEPDGSRWWYYRDQLHREDGPAMELSDGHREWRLNGYRHRTDGPAVIDAAGNESWYLRGNRHREGGPAVTETDGRQMWYVGNALDRTDGPAIIRSNGATEWWLEGQRRPALERLDAVVKLSKLVRLPGVGRLLQWGLRRLR